MKILFNTTSLEKGGAERVTANLCNTLSHDNDVSIVANSIKNISYELDSTIKLYQLDKKSNKFSLFRNFNRMVNTIKICRTIKPDIIISFLPIPSFRILLIKPFIRCKIIVSDRNDPKVEYTGISYLLMKLLYKYADGFVFQTKTQRDFFSKKIRNKSVIIPNPLKDDFLEAIPCVKKENTIITVGRLHKQKNQALLINAFSKIHKKYPEYILKIYGEGELKTELEQQIKSLNLDSCVKLCGIVDDVKKELLKSKIFVLTSNYEGMPNSLIEAMACGLPCISTDCPCGGPSELIESNINGILVPMNDEKEIFNAIDYLLSNEEAFNKMGELASNIVYKCNPEKINCEWVSFINKVRGKNI